MKGMTHEEYAQVTEFIQKHHKFGQLISPVENKITVRGEDFNLMIKYIDTCYDTRSHDIWMINFRGFCPDYRVATNHFNAFNLKPDYFKFNTLFEWVMAFLKGEWTNNQILKDCIIKS